MARKKPKNKAAQALRAIGVKKTSAARRTEIARLGGQARQAIAKAQRELETKP